MADIKFLQALRQKLSTGNRRSIQLNAIPARNQLRRLDLYDIDLLQPGLAQSLVDALLEKEQFSLPLNFSSKQVEQLKFQKEAIDLKLLARKLDMLNIENHDHFLEYGIKPFALGYPLLIQRDPADPSRTISAPVLIWHFDLLKASDRSYRWSIKREDDDPLYFNEVLSSFLAQEEQITLDGLDDELEMPLGKEQLIAICNRLLQQLNLSPTLTSHSVVKSPDREMIREAAKVTPHIRWSGVFGLYKLQKQAIIKDYDEVMKHHKSFFFDALKVPAYQEHPLSSVQTDPSQDFILQTMTSHPKKIIQGPPGTGKSHALTAIITNALANGAKCLVVCEKRTALEVIEQNLAKLGLSDLCVIVEDIQKDRRKIVESVRNRSDTPAALTETSTHVFDQLVKDVLQQRKTVNELHDFLQHPLLGQDSWASLVARYFHLAEHRHPEVHKKLDPTTFEFQFSEFRSIADAAHHGAQLFSQLPSLQHPMERLGKKYFLQEKAGESVWMLENDLRQWLQQLKELEQELSSTLNSYRSELQQRYSSALAETESAAAAVREAIIDGDEKFGEAVFSFTVSSRTWWKIAGLLSDRHKQKLQHQDKMLQKIDALRDGLKKHQWMQQEISYPKPPENLKKWLLPVEQIINTTSTQKNNIDKWLDDELSQFSDKHLHTLMQPDWSAKASADAKSISTFKNEFEKTGLIDEPGFPDELKIQEWHDYLLNLEALLLQIQEKLPDFRSWYGWRSFLLKQEPKVKEIILLLSHLNPTNWALTVEQWYLHWLLVRNEPEYPLLNSLVQTLEHQHKEVAEALTESISRIWQNRQNESVKRFNSGGFNVKRLYNKRGSQGRKRNSLRHIIEMDFALFTDFFPVLLINPVVCSSVIPLREGLFDLVIFDEASQLRIEDTFPSLLRGRHRIVSGDVHQMPPSDYFSGSVSLGRYEEDEDLVEDDEEILIAPPGDLDLVEAQSLLEYAEDKGFQRCYLDFHYRSRHPQLINFSNAAFYGERLVPMPPTKDYKAIRLKQVNGVYTPNDRINVQEAEEVLQILEQVQPGPDERMPSVGVATFNISQRNLILELIQERKIADDVARQQYLRLEQAGLFVKNLENIQGDERDIMILSTTFGRTAQGDFRQMFGPINRQYGYKLLNVIITRAKHQVFVCTSVPQEVYGQYAQELLRNGNTGKGVFYAYLAYAESIEKGHTDIEQRILELLLENSRDTVESRADSNRRNISAFSNHVAGQLQQRLDGSRVVTNYNCGGFNIEIAVKSAEIPGMMTVIECDTPAGGAGVLAYNHTIYRQQRLKDAGFRFVRTSSIDWWVNPEQEIQLLIVSC